MRSKTPLLTVALVLVLVGLFSLISLVAAASGGGNQVYYPAVGAPSEIARVDSNLWLSTVESYGDAPLIWANAETGRWAPQDRIANSVDSFDQDLWVLGGSWVSLYDGNTWTQWSTGTALAIGSAEQLRVDNTGLPWVVSDSALSRYNGAYWERLIEGPAYPNWASYQEVAPVSATEAWVAGWYGLVHLTGSEIETFDSSTVGFTRGNLLSLAYDAASGEAWVGSETGGLCHGDGTSWTCVTIDDGLLSERIRAVEVGFDSVWVAYDDVTGTLAQYQSESGWSHLDLPAAFSSGKVTLIHAEPPETLWVGLADGALLRYAVGGEGADAWSVVTAIDGPRIYTTNQVFGVAGTVYSTGWTGASEFDGEVWEQAPFDYTAGAELGPANYWLSDPGYLRHSTDGINWDDTYLGSDIDVTRIASDTLSNHLWLGTEEGLWEYDPDTGTVVATWNPADETEAEGNHVVDLEVGADGAVWLIAREFSNSGTIARFDPQQNTWTAHYTDMVAYGAAQDSAGKLWFSLRRSRYTPYVPGKLVSFDGSTWSEYDQDDGLPWTYVEDVAVDAADRVWVTGLRYEGTWPYTFWSGFSAWDGAAFTTFYGEFTTLRGVWPDRASGDLWAAAGPLPGVIRFNPEGLAATEEILTDGAVVTAADDSGTVVFPPGSLPEGTVVTVVTNPPQDSSNLIGQSSVLDVSWSGESRQVEATDIYTVTLSYVAHDLGLLIGTDRLGLYGWNSDSASWERIESAVHDLARMEISAGANEPGMFQIMGVRFGIYLPLVLR